MADFIVTFIAVTFLVAGTVKGVTGMGLPTVAMGVLGAVLSPLTAASLLIVPSMVTNVWQLAAGPSFAAMVWRLWPMMGASAIATLVAVPLLTGGSAGGATLALGATLTVYAVYTLLARPFRVRQASEIWLSPLIGLLTGLIAGATGVFVIPAVPYLQSLGLEKDDLVQALGMSFTVSTLTLAIGLASRGAWQVDQLAYSLMAVVPALIGMWLGQSLRQRISPATFRRGFLIVLALLGAEMVLRSV